MSRVLQDSVIWEKAGVNVSVVHCVISESYRAANLVNAAENRIFKPEPVSSFTARINSVMYDAYTLVSEPILTNQSCSKFGLRHKEYIAAYGDDNVRPGRRETAGINTFLRGVANCDASILVGRDTDKEGKGYFKNRRSTISRDPSVVTSMIAETTILWNKS